TFDPATAITLHRDRAVTPRHEAPILHELVAEGELPPLADRLPSEPTVMEGVDGVGEYGGTWLRLANALEDVGIITYRMSGAHLARWSPMGYPIQPHIAKTIEASPDQQVWTVTLRKGMKWSDGHPF